MNPIKPFWVATLEQACIVFGAEKIVELSNLDDSEAEILNRKRVEIALNMAEDTLLAYDQMCPEAGRLKIRINFRRLQLDVARYYLDTEKNRSFVRERYDDVMAFVKAAFEVDARTPYDKKLAEQYGITAVRDNRVLMESDAPVPVLRRETNRLYRKGTLFDSSRRNRTGPEVYIDPLG